MRAYYFLKQLFTWSFDKRSHLIYWTDSPRVDVGQRFVITHVDESTGEIGIKAI